MFKFFVSLLSICGVLRADVVIDNGQAEQAAFIAQKATTFKKIVDQAIERQEHLPAGAIQKVIIDVRGQICNESIKRKIQSRISENCSGIIRFEDIAFFD